MLRGSMRRLISRAWFRIALAAALVIVGLAPIGAPILSDNAWRQATLPSDGGHNSTQARPFTYRWTAEAGQATRIERSDDGGQSWHGVADIPATIAQLQAVRGDEQTVIARSPRSIWVSRDGGASWTQASGLPSKALALAVSGKEAGLLLVGTESAGLLVSRDLGESWQPMADAALADGNRAALAVTALALDPNDDSIIYAATGIWLGTSTTRLTPIGTFVSVDGGQRWLQHRRSPVDAAPITQLTPIASHPLAVLAGDGQNTQTLALTLTPDLQSTLESADAGLRAAAARAMGLLGDAAAAPLLLARLTDDNALVGERAAEALGSLGDTSVVPALLVALDAPDGAVRGRAAVALGLLRAEAAVDQLGALLGAGGPLTARHAAEALAAIGTPDALAALLVPLADAEMTPARHAAMAGLEASGANAAPALAVALSAQNVVLRANAAEMLGYLRTPTSTGALAAALKDGEPAVRTQAAWALGEIGTAEARSALATAVQAEADTAARMAAATALARVDATTSSRATSFGEVLLAQLAQMPASRWTLMALFMALAAALLWLGPRQAHVRLR